MEKKIILEIDRTLNLMGLNSDKLLLEQKLPFLGEFISTVRRSIDDAKSRGDVNVVIGRRPYNVKAIEKLIDDFNNFGNLNLAKRIEVVTQLRKVFPTETYKSIVSEISERDLLEELSKFRDDDNLLENIKKFITDVVADGDEEEGEILFILIGDKLAEQVRRYKNFDFNGVDEFPFITDDAIEAESRRVASRATDDIADTGSDTTRASDEVSRRTLGGEREFIPDRDIDPSDPNFTTDGRRIIYDADNRPTAVKKIEKVEPNEPEPIEDPNLADPEIRIPDRPQPKLNRKISELADAIDDSQIKFQEKNKKLFDSLNENLRLLDDDLLSLADKNKIRKDIGDISKKLSKVWNRTFLGGGGRKSFIEMVDFLKKSKSEFARSEQAVIDDIIKYMTDGLPEDFFVEISRWQRLKNAFSTIGAILKGVKLGIFDDVNIISVLLDFYRKLRKKPTKLEGKELLEGVLASPQILKKWKRAADEIKNSGKNSDVIIRELVALTTGLTMRIIGAAAPYLAVESILASINDDEILTTIEEWKTSGTPQTQEQIDEIVNLILLQYNVDYDYYTDEEGNDIGLTKLVFLNVLDELDEEGNYIPMVSRVKLFKFMWDYLNTFRAKDFQGKNNVKEKRKELESTLREIIGGNLSSEGIDKSKEDNDSWMIDEVTDIESLERLAQHIEQIENMGIDLELDSTFNTIRTNPELFIQIKSDFGNTITDDELKSLINTYVKYSDSRFEFMCGEPKRKGVFEKDSEGKWSMKWPDNDTYFPFANPEFGNNLAIDYCTPVSEWTVGEGTGKKGLINVLEQRGSGRGGGTSGSSGSSGTSGSSDSVLDNLTDLITGSTAGPTYGLTFGREATSPQKNLYDEVVKKLKDKGGEEFINYVNLWKNITPNPKFGVTYENPPSNKDEIVYVQRKHPSPIEGLGVTVYVIRKNSSGEFELYEYDQTTKNLKSTPKTTITNMVSESLIKKYIMEELENKGLSQMIDDKLREFNFYSANDKGKQKVVFTDEDREKISKEFDDLIKKYPEDIAFIRAVVIAKGEDKKSGEPIVRLGSYYNNANIELPFNSQMNGLGKLLDGGIVYFTIINNEGPDYRDFKIVGGDKIPEVEFNDKDKEEIELDNYTHSHDQEMSEMDEPFEEVMKKKEQKGLSSLLKKGDFTSDLTKRQKEVLENLKKKGFKFEKPENADIYERVRVSSKEFNESINAWKPRKDESK